MMNNMNNTSEAAFIHFSDMPLGNFENGRLYSQGNSRQRIVATFPPAFLITSELWSGLGKIDASCSKRGLFKNNLKLADSSKTSKTMQ